MAKEHQRSNKEAKKPKADKPKAAAPVSPFAPKGGAAPANNPKKKG